MLKMCTYFKQILTINQWFFASQISFENVEDY